MCFVRIAQTTLRLPFEWTQELVHTMLDPLGRWAQHGTLPTLSAPGQLHCALAPRWSRNASKRLVKSVSRPCRGGFKQQKGTVLQNDVKPQNLAGQNTAFWGKKRIHTEMLLELEELGQSGGSLGIQVTGAKLRWYQSRQRCHSQ